MLLVEDDDELSTMLSRLLSRPLPEEGSVLAPALARLHQIDADFSTYRADSPISRLGRGEAALTDCPPDVALVLGLCAQATCDTDGWDSALADGRLDPSGLVKGWAVEEASRLLTSAGSPHHCINGGGDVLGAGGRWRFGIDDPRQPGQLLAVVAGTDLAVATSGTAQRGAHIIDLFTRRSTAALASVTVIGPSLTRADVLATAACAHGNSACDWLAAVDGYDSLVVHPDGTTWTAPICRPGSREPLARARPGSTLVEHPWMPLLRQGVEPTHEAQGRAGDRWVPAGRGVVIVYWQHGYMIDWNWAAELAVWTTSSDRAESLVATHRLDHVPRRERDAIAVAEQWWHQTGSAGVASARDRERNTEEVA